MTAYRTPASVSITAEQLVKFGLEAGLTLDQFKEAVANLVPSAVRELSVTNEFAAEEVESSYAYPKDYKVKGIAEQVATLRQLLPELKDATFDEELAARPLPPNAELRAAIPKWETLAETYGEAVEKVLAAIKHQRTFTNCRDGQLGAEYLRQHEKTVKAWEKLGREQKGHDILVVAAQFGLRHKGRSVRRAREVMNAVEFGLGAFAVGIMLLTHPEREVQRGQLHVDCAGDECAPDADGDFSGAPIFGWGDGRVKFSVGWLVGEGEFGAGSFDYTDGYCGSASAFLSQ
ncbi:MAG: hypothetical protein AAB562_02680 [Patescibacteria group bacterium]